MKKSRKILVVTVVIFLILVPVLFRLYGARPAAKLPEYDKLESARSLQITYENGAGGNQAVVQTDREDAEVLLQLLAQGTVRYMGKQLYFSIPAYGLSALPVERHDSDLMITPDGLIQIPTDNGKSVRYYRLSGCDLSAVELELQRLLGMT